MSLWSIQSIYFKYSPLKKTLVWLRHASLVSGLLLVGACSMVAVNPPGDTAVPTLADLSPAVMPDKTVTLPQVDLDTLVATYKEVLDVTVDENTRLRVKQRLAGLEMKRAEEKIYQQNTMGGEFDLAIAAYQDLLATDPDSEGNDTLLYQMSKAYDLGGQIDQSMRVLTELVKDYPTSTHYIEAQFRRAEIFFSHSEYKQSELAYKDVVDHGNSSRHFQNSLYMYGWSLFKQQRYRASLRPFSAMLDLNVPENNRLDNLDRGKREITEDTFKIMSIVFSYLDGAQTINEVYEEFGARHYLPLLYTNLGKLYLSQERYRDSAETYSAFISLYPQSDHSPVFYADLIDAYIAGGFPGDVLREKENYIALYGIHSHYWARKTERSRDYIRPFLEKYLPELAKYYHAKAQGLSAQPTVTDGANIAVLKSLNTAKTSSISKAELELIVANDYLKAGNYYQEFIDTFPQNDQVPEIHFLLAESRFAAGVYREAIAAYEVVAYKYADYERGAVAGYSAIVSYGKLLAILDQEPLAPAKLDQLRLTQSQQSQILLPQNTLARDELHILRENWLRLKIASQLRFASVYQSDSHAPAVLVKSAEELMALAEYRHAVDAAKQLLRRDPAAKKQLRKTAWLVIGHSEFELQQYANAEIAYDKTLALMDNNDNDDKRSRNSIVDRVAASVYKQAEQALAAGDSVAAVDQYLRVVQVAPTSAIAATAQYDAATELMNIANYEQAVTVLEGFRRSYPNHSLVESIPAKMVVAFQQSGQWAMAGAELTAIYRKSNDEAVKKESLYQAAELFEKAGDQATAIKRYRSYANAYPEPFATAMEARYKLSELYRQTNQASKRRFWLKKIIAADKSAGVGASERSRYLAAYSSNVLADDEYQTFKQIKLKLPLKTSLNKKKQALNKTLAAYQAVADYAVEEFATQATFRIAAVYSQLSQDLMKSQRPNNLDELALEQYEILLEEQAFPFEEKAIDIHEANIRRSWSGIYDDWVKQSFAALKVLLPARYGKEESRGNFSHGIY
ncbi:MAG: tetratricopeptide repeat protein [Spongiibacteraceae bacterium]